MPPNAVIVDSLLLSVCGSSSYPLAMGPWSVSSLPVICLEGVLRFEPQGQSGKMQELLYREFVSVGGNEYCLGLAAVWATQSEWATEMGQGGHIEPLS